MVEREVFSARSTAVKTTPSHARNSLLLKLNTSGGFPSKISWVPSTGTTINTCKETCFTEGGFTEGGFNRRDTRIHDSITLSLEERWNSRKKGLLEIVKRKDDQILAEMERRGDQIPAFVKENVHVMEDMIEHLLRGSLIEDKEPAYMKIGKSMWIRLRAGIMEAIELRDENRIRAREFCLAYDAFYRYYTRRRYSMGRVVMNFEKKSK